MILKASQRAGGQNLAVHLMLVDDNEHVDLHELRGFTSDNLKGAFREAEATASKSASASKVSRAPSSSMKRRAAVMHTACGRASMPTR